MASALNMPSGFRFYPTDEELLRDYLVWKCSGLLPPAPIITEVDLDQCDPWKLPVRPQELLLAKRILYTRLGTSVYSHQHDRNSNETRNGGPHGRGRAKEGRDYSRAGLRWTATLG
ncbi:hypothetical protein CRG98_042653 [Punica granatum]|uniref:NAC domain-containing protein n=1 Tax=Punica granatum TaxID=22663 RepID=A0A2I0HZ15_PUNGR|nr:hypothetical protein CRG98_042653 [Punica granatum]